jgi:hypothetical protein
MQIFHKKDYMGKGCATERGVKGGKAVCKMSESVRKETK